MMQVNYLITPISEDWQQLAWYPIAAAGQAQPKVAQGSFADLAKAVQEAPVVALLPSQSVNFFTATLPKGRDAQMRKALPFLLEEQVAEDIDAVHIALPTHYQLGEPTHVCVIQKVRIKALYEGLKSHKINCQVAIPESLCLPMTPQAWSVYLDAEQAWVRQAEDLGFCVPCSALNTLLNLALAQAEQPPEKLQVYYSPEAEQTAQALASLEISVQLNATTGSTLAFFAERYVPEVALNVLQGPFVMKPLVSEIKRYWQIAAGLLAGIILMQMMQANNTYQKLSTQHEQVQAKILSYYQQVFPGAAQVSSPRQLLERELAQTGRSADNLLFDYLMDLTEPVLFSDDVSLQQIAYQNNEIRLDIIADDFAALSAFESLIQSEGLSVRQETASLEDEQVLAQLRISRGGL